MALFAIAVFAFMALSTLFSTVRSFRQAYKKKPNFRVRRLVGGRESARAVAKSVVCEIAQNQAEAVEQSRAQDRLTPALEEALDEARVYYLGRVEARHRDLFTQAVDEHIVGRGKKLDGGGGN